MVNFSDFFTNGNYNIKAKVFRINGTITTLTVIITTPYLIPDLKAPNNFKRLELISLENKDYIKQDVTHLKFLEIYPEQKYVSDNWIGINCIDNNFLSDKIIRLIRLHVQC